MKQTFGLFIAVVFLCGAAEVHGQPDEATLDNINCDDASSISFTIKIPDIAEWGSDDADSWRLNGVVGCEPTFDQVGGFVTYSGIDVATCDSGDPSSTPDGTKFEYEFVIEVDAEAGSTISPVTYAYDHHYVVKCFYNKEQENLMASFQPRHSLTDSGSAVADFIIDFTVHLDDDDSEVTTIIDLSTAVYGKLVITGDGDFPQGLDIHLKEVTADTDNTAGGEEFALITNGCAVSSVVSSTTCDANEEARFNFLIFRFPGQITADEVFLRARVIVCLTSNTASVCRTECSCSSGRKRRETLEEIQQTEYFVEVGPIKIRNPDQESDVAADKEEGAALPASMIAVVAAVCALLAVAIVSAVVLIAFRRRRQNVANVELQNEDSVTA